MKKLLIALLSLIMVFGCVSLVACGNKTAEIAVVTDVGLLKDGGFNQGTYEGAEAFAKANDMSYAYYQPANGDKASDNDRIAAMRKAISNGAKIIVAPGFLQAAAMRTVAKENPEVKFVFVDGWSLTDSVDEKGNDNGTVLQNVTAIVYKEQESGYMAGYAAVSEGYTKLGATLGGGGTNPACNRFGYGFMQGANDAAKSKNIQVTMKYSYKYGDNFQSSPELKTQISGWYDGGVEVVFACGGSMFQSVKAAAEATSAGKVIGVDVDQSGLSDRVITSAVKGLKESVQLILDQWKAGEWDAKLGGKTSNLGAAEDATGLPTATWSLKNFTVENYQTLFNGIKNGTITVKSDVPSDCKADENWYKGFSNLTVDFEK